MAPTCSNCRRLRPHKKSRRENAAFEFRRCRAHDGVPKRPAAPFAKRRGPIFGDNFQAVARHCLPCNSGARRLTHNGSPQREARTILPRSHHCQYRATLLYFLAADLISAWPAPIRQPTPTPPKVAPANFAADPTFATDNVKHAVARARPARDRRQARYSGAAFRSRLQRGGLSSRNARLRFQSDRSPGMTGRSDINPKNR